MSSHANESTPLTAWFGLIEGPSGYADEARGFLRALERAGHAPAARDITGGKAEARLDPPDRAMVDRMLARSHEGAAVAVHHYAPTWLRNAPVVPRAANVARTMFETDRIPRSWLHQLLGRDEIWVPCEHNRDAFERGGIPSSRLRVIGGTMDFEAYRPGLEPLAIDVPGGHRVFLSAFEFSARKAWRELLHAWARTFAATDGVCLVLKTTADPGGQLARRLQTELDAAARAAGRSDTAPVRLLSRVLSPTDLARLYAAADAFVLCSRGEGWGRTSMEALSMGLPTIASRWSGPTEFMDDATSWLIDGELIPVPADHDVFADDVTGHRWFEPDLDALSAALADVAGDFEAARRRAAPARAQLIARFGPEATTARLIAALRDVAERADTFAGTGRECTVRGPFGRNASLALVNDRLLAELEATGRRVHARALGAPAELSPRPAISHSWPPDFSAAGEGPSALILPWEFGHPPADWVQRIRRDIDRVYVPSEYVRQGYLEAGVPEGIVEVIPNGVDLEIFASEGDRAEFAGRAGCVFLFVGGTIWRKGIDLLLDAWADAFGPDDDVLLVIKDFGIDSHYRGQTHGRAIRDLLRRPDVAPVLYLDREIAADDLPALYRAADVLVAPYRGEGFCLPVLEAMACGLPAIHTGIGPTNEFVGGGGWAVRARRRELDGEISGVSLAGRGYVHEVDPTALVQALRDAAADGGERARRGAAARAAALAFSWPAAAARLEASLAELEAEACRPARRVRPAQVQSRGHTAVYAPDWEDEEAWAPVLATWARTVPADTDVTLVMPVRGDRAEAVMGRVIARLEQQGLPLDGLPDLALHQQADDDPAPLVAVADVVLLDAGQAASTPPALARRALRTIAAEPGALRAYAAQVGPVSDRAAA